MMQPFSFLGAASADPSAQQGMNQYIQQGQSQINPGQAQVAQSSPIAAAGGANLARALQMAQQPQLPAQAIQNGLNGSAAMGQPGPTPQALAWAQGLQPQSLQNQINPQTGNATPQAFMQGGY